jgi:hypothetical protein
LNKLQIKNIAYYTEKPQRPGFDFTPVREGLAIKEVAMGQIFLSIFFDSLPVCHSTSAPNSNLYSFITPMLVIYNVIEATPIKKSPD